MNSQRRGVWHRHRQPVLRPHPALREARGLLAHQHRGAPARRRQSRAAVRGARLRPVSVGHQRQLEAPAGPVRRRFQHPAHPRGARPLGGNGRLQRPARGILAGAELHPRRVPPQRRRPRRRLRQPVRERGATSSRGTPPARSATGGTSTCGLSPMSWDRRQIPASLPGATDPSEPTRTALEHSAAQTWRRSRQDLPFSALPVRLADTPDRGALPAPPTGNQHVRPSLLATLLSRRLLSGGVDPPGAHRREPPDRAVRGRAAHHRSAPSPPRRTQQPSHRGHPRRSRRGRRDPQGAPRHPGPSARAGVPRRLRDDPGLVGFHGGPPRRARPRVGRGKDACRASLRRRVRRVAAPAPAPQPRDLGHHAHRTQRAPADGAGRARLRLPRAPERTRAPRSRFRPPSCAPVTPPPTTPST